METETKRDIEELEKMEKEDETAFGEDGFWTRKAIQRIRDIERPMIQLEKDLLVKS